MKRDDIEARVRRFCSGDTRVEDLNRIFAWLRFRRDAGHAIAEIGHFAAHPEGRNQGTVYTRAKDLFLSSTLFFLGIETNRNGAALVYDDKTQRPAFLARLDLMSEMQLKEGLGISRKKARKLLLRALDKLASQPDNRRIIFFADEYRVWNFLAKRFTYSELFSDETLVADLDRSLRSQGLIQQRQSLTPYVNFISLYVAATMHLAEVDLGDGLRGQLTAGFDPNGTLSVSLQTPWTLPGYRHVESSFTIFTSKLVLSDYCAPEDMPVKDRASVEYPNLLAESAHWKKPIELDSSGRITLLN